MLLAFALLVACELPARGFVVTHVTPVDGGDAGPAVRPGVTFSQAPDDDVCEAAIVLAALGDDDRVAWEETFDLLPDESEAAKPHTYQLVPEVLLTLGMPYAVIVPNGEDGCISQSGEDVVPVVSRFTVVSQ